MWTEKTTLPTGTYRVQLNSEFDLNAAADIAGYLSRLGISHLYVSPYLQAAPGSKHGYDVVDHRKINTELGGEEAHQRLCRSLVEHQLGQVLDIVPNHMAMAGKMNGLWWDVLENGPASRYAPFFDVDWECSEVSRGEHSQKVLMPVLGDHYGKVLEAGQIRVIREDSKFLILYYENLFPIDPNTLGTVLYAAAAQSGSTLLMFIADNLSSLSREPGRRYRDMTVLYDMLNRLFQEEPQTQKTVDNLLNQINTDPDVLDTLLEAQNYRLALWRTSSTKLNYRRFFNINTLIGLNMEQQEVFDETHCLIQKMVQQGQLDGLRVDHPDGLWDPQEYLERLCHMAPNAWIVVEKILEPGESLPENWPVAGTTGYDFLNRVGGLFIDPNAEGPLTDFYRRYTGETADFQHMMRLKKHKAIEVYFGGEINRLTSLLQKIADKDCCCRDYSRNEIQQAVTELVACFPVYRTYVRASQGKVSQADIQYVTKAVELAKANRSDLGSAIFDFIRRVLTLNAPGQLESEFVMRFQQFTGPAMAKGVEDTAFYCYNRLIALNEVGGDPGRFGVSLAEFHEQNIEIQHLWPGTMNTTSTHDTKRSEDVRARISLISEIPDQWISAVERWTGMNEKHRRNHWPDRNTQYFIYQTLFGAWPLPADRAVAHMEKAIREAKVYTTWTEINPEYEKTVSDFVKSILADEEFTRDMTAFVEPMRVPGYINSLAQVLVKLTASGIPDFYQGTEIWDLSLVDPDNRRPVDYNLRQRMFDMLSAMTIEQVMEHVDEGFPKLYLIHKVLRFRREHPHLLAPSADYRAILARGDRADHVVAFMRGEQVLTVIPRLSLRLAGDWKDTQIQIPDGNWKNILTDGKVHKGLNNVADLLKKFPVALLVGEKR